MIVSLSRKSFLIINEDLLFKTQEMNVSIIFFLCVILKTVIDVEDPNVNVRISVVRYNVMWRQRTNEIIDWICIAMFILGTLGNSLGLIVFSSRKFRRTTYGRLAIASLIINLLCVFRYSLILHSNTRLWISHKVGQSWLNCKLYRFSSCLRILSAFVIVAWTYERFTYVTINYSFLTNHPFLRRYKFYFMVFISFIIVCTLTGPTVYFYQPTAILVMDRSNTTSDRYSIEKNRRE